MNIKLTTEELEHICVNAPGTCKCSVCERYWKQVNKWVESGYKI